MPTHEWTDARLDDLVETLTNSLNLIHEDIRGLRTDLNALNGRLITILLCLCVALIGAVAGLTAAAL